jgi:3-hydroxybutyryl-CoA dehydratase
MTPPGSIATWSLDAICEGQSCSFDHVISAQEVDAFAQLTGDVSPLHVDDAFARQSGFPGRVVHGAFLAGLVSRLIGVYLPGANGLLLALDLKFVMPVQIGNTVCISGLVTQKSEAAGAIVIRVEIRNISADDVVAAKGTATVRVSGTSANAGSGTNR